MTDPLGQSQVLPYIEGITKSEYHFHLISFEKKERFEANRKQIENICNQAGIVWHPVSYTKKPPLLSTVYDIIRMYILAKKLHTIHSFSALHCRSYISAIIGLLMKQKFQTKFIFDMRGFWADERVDGKIWNLKNPIFKLVYKVYKKLEEKFILHADAIISLTEAGKKEIQTWGSYKKSKAEITVIPCAADFSLFNLNTENEKKIAKEKIGVNENTSVLSYLGSVGTWYMLDEMLDFYTVYKKKHRAVFLFITPDDPESILEKATKKNISSSEIIIKSASRKEVPRYMAASDFSLFFIKPMYSKLASSPTKLGELLAMGVPVIANANVGDVEEIIKATEGGIICDSFNTNAYEKTLENLTITTFNPIEARKKAAIYYNLENAIQKYTRVYEYLLK